MRRGIVGLCCIFFLLLSACGADEDVILQNEEDEATAETADSAETTTADAARGEGSGLEDASVEEDGPEAATDAGEVLSGADAAGESAGICVYICGAVEKPGVYRLPDGGRVYELVELAGGFLPDADERSVNLAQALDDGAMVTIPTEEESASGVAADTYTTAAGIVTGPDAGEAKVNLNTADAETLTSLNGIGEAKAAAIVAYREEHGAFQTLEEIMEVSGIGEGTYDKIKDDITL